MRATYFDGLEIKLQQTLFWISPFFIFIFIILFVIFVARKNIKSEMVSIGISLVFIINRTLHGCLKIQTFSSRVENIYSAWPCKTLFIYWYLFLTIFTFNFFFTENILYTLWLCTFILITGTVLLKTHLLQKCVYLTDVQRLYKK